MNFVRSPTGEQLVCLFKVQPDKHKLVECIGRQFEYCTGVVDIATIDQKYEHVSGYILRIC